MNSNSSITINHVTYEILKLIGQGSYGQVYLVKNIQTQTQYALKKQSHITEKEKEVLTKFKSITFTNVVNTIEILQINGIWYILMEYCEQNLYEYLTEIRQIDDRDIRYVMQQIANGVQQLHSHGLIHRDIKPENILRFSIKDAATQKIQYTYKLCDFGLVSKLDQAKTTFVGTPYYQAPELLIDNSGYSYQVDIWALGALMYELLTGNILFNGKNVEQIYQAIIQDNPSEKILKIPKLDFKYQQLMISMLNRIPEERPNINQVLDQLKSFFTIKSYTICSTIDNSKENLPENNKFRHQQPRSAIKNISNVRDITPLNTRLQITPIVRAITPMNSKQQIVPQNRAITPMNQTPNSTIRGVTPIIQPPQLKTTNQTKVATEFKSLNTTTRGVPPQHPYPSQRQHRQQVQENTTKIVRGKTPMIIKKDNETIIVVKDNSDEQN